MKFKTIGIITLVVCVFAGAAIIGKTQTDGIAKSWANIDSLYNSGLPESALTEVEILLEKSKHDKNSIQGIKSLFYITMLKKEANMVITAGTLQRLEKEIPLSKGLYAALLHSIIASAYWQYYVDNAWKIKTRTQSIDFMEDDVTTWDQMKLLTKTMYHYNRSLDNNNLLKKTSINDFSDILSNTEGAEIRVPTLYDFLAHRAMTFFIESQNEISKTSNEFNLNNIAYLSSYDTFTQCKLITKDTISFKFNALKIMQDLIAFHQNDNNPGALIDIDLIRLGYIQTSNRSDIFDSIYEESLEKLYTNNKKDPAAAEVLYQIARLYGQKEEKYKTTLSGTYSRFKNHAIDLCDSAIQMYPNSYGSCMCTCLKTTLLEKKLSLQVENFNIPKTNLLALIGWKNINKLWIRVVPFVTKRYDDEKIDIYHLEQTKVCELINAIKPTAEWTIDLPDSGDFKDHSAEIKIPPLNNGKYLLAISANPQFSSNKNNMEIAPLQVSRICYFTRTQRHRFEVYVRDRQTGCAIANATVTRTDHLYDNNGQLQRLSKRHSFTTDTEGKVVFIQPVLPAQYTKYSFTLDFTYENDYLSDKKEFSIITPSIDTTSQLKTFFFTDRSLYRPGQTIFFKGIVVKQQNGKTEIVPNKKTEISYMDASSNKVSRLSLVTNKNGSMQGSFTAPVKGFNNIMWIKNEWGETKVSIEEYKRPKFELYFNPVTESHRLNSPITITGMAKTYAGTGVDCGSVSYRVYRSSRFPSWNSWNGISNVFSPNIEITSGFTKTDDTGCFKISFNAIVDSTLSRLDNPTFVFHISAQVTDANGEGRICETEIPIGYSALKLSLDIPKQIDKNSDSSYLIKATNQNGVLQPTQGKIRIFKLKNPTTPLRSRIWNMPTSYTMTKKEYDTLFPGFTYSTEDSINTWPVENKTFEKEFDTKVKPSIAFSDKIKWRQGMYKVESVATDTFGDSVKATQYFMLYASLDTTPPIPQCDWFLPLITKGEPGEQAQFLIGTGEKNVKVLFEIEHQDSIIKTKWLNLSNTQSLIKIPIFEKYRGNFSVHFSFIKNNRIYNHDQVVTVPWTNKKLDFTFETFRNKMVPGKLEEWKIKITGSHKDKIVTELAMAMYDASLDIYRPHEWYFDIYPVKTDPFSYLNWNFGEQFISLNAYYNQYDNVESGGCSTIMYPTLISKELDMDLENTLITKILCRDENYILGQSPEIDENYNTVRTCKTVAAGDLSNNARIQKNNSFYSNDSQIVAPNISNIKTRKNLSETAFFYPNLTTNEQGEIIVSFTAPEALTRWKVLGFAHTKDLQYGMFTKELVTSKTLMVMPNLPRFLRENDKISLTAKVMNIAEKDLVGAAQLMLTDATTMKPVDTEMTNKNAIKNFTVKKGLSQTISWDIIVPEGLSAVSVKIVATANEFSDGEESILPVVSNKMLVTETMPLPVRNAGKTNFTLKKLVSQSNKSETARNHKLTLEFTQNPVWYAVQALPYLMEFPQECAEQTFSRLYANTVATTIANSYPKIKAVFAAWKNAGKDALLSNLEKNQDLKSAMLEETPWVLEGKNESASKQRIGLLFDVARMADQFTIAKSKLSEMQNPSGGWSWFKGMPQDRYMTQYIVTGFGKLAHMKMLDLSTDITCKDMVERGIRYLDNCMLKDYQHIENHKNLDSNHLENIHIQYLYARSFFRDIPVADDCIKAMDYYKNQAKKYWLRNNRYMQGMIALSLYRANNRDDLPKLIIKSLKENSLQSNEMGMYWKEHYEGYSWYEAPIETQTLYIEAFNEITHDTASVEAMKTWLLKSKQTENWKTTKATAEACYALLLQGKNMMETDNSITVSLGSTIVDPAKLKNNAVEAGTGYFKTSWHGNEIKPEMGNVTVTKSSTGVAWGAMYWQYFEQLDKISSAATPLALSKKLFIKRHGDRGPVLYPITNQSTISVGDKITVRVELRVDRNLEYVHMKDMRAAGFEPVNVLSGYKYQDGLGYYESTRDLATHFFFSWLPKGVYVFEYELVASHRGNFSNGISSIECMYAPEFTSHSEGMRVVIGK